MCATLRLFSHFTWLLCFCGITAAEAGTGCEVVNLMPAFWRAWETSDAAAQIRATLIVPYPDLYNDNYVNLPAGAKWDAAMARERTYVEAHREEVTAAESYLSAHAQPLMAQFQQTFPDYKCDFTFYIAPSFGQMDGSAAFVNGRHRIIFAPDVIPRYHQLSELKVLIDHETFHIYHHQVTGVYGASAEAVPTILEALWGEGLATFVSWRMNPEVSLDTALLQPGIPEAAYPHLADIAKGLLAHLYWRSELFYFMASVPILDAAVQEHLTIDQSTLFIYSALTLYGYGGTVFMVFYGIATAPRGYLFYRSAYFPRWLGALLLLAGTGFIVKNVIAVALPQYDSDLLLAPMFVAMIALAVWLLLKGVARQRWPVTSNLPL